MRAQCSPRWSMGMSASQCHNRTSLTPDRAMAYQPPKQLLEVLQKIQYEEALPAGDPRYVETQTARGSEKTFSRLAKKIGWDPATTAFFPPGQSHVLFFGHVGSGKTTELRRYARRLDASKRYCVIEVDAVEKLDVNNLQYADALMAMAESLVATMQAGGYALAPADLEPLHGAVAKVVTTRSDGRELSAEVKAAASAGGGLPGLFKLLVSFTASAKTNATVKTEWRSEVRNTFTVLAGAFNQLIRGAEAALRQAGRADRIVFLLDGTDKMRGEDTQRFFVYDAEQLLAIQAFVIYAAPLHLKYAGTLAGKLDADLVLPMIKLLERDGSRCEAGWAALTELLLRRADRSLFASQAEVDRLVEHCGGHPRELLRLLKLCCEYADGSIDAAAVGRSINQLASDYRRFLEPEDYALLVRLDRDEIHSGNDERTRALLYRLALLEYNDGAWRRSHPGVRTLEGYRGAAAQGTLPSM